MKYIGYVAPIGLVGVLSMTSFIGKAAIFVIALVYLLGYLSYYNYLDKILPTEAVEKLSDVFVTMRDLLSGQDKSSSSSISTDSE